MAAACVAMALMGCRKDGDTSPPQARIVWPGAGFSLGVPDTLAVRVAVSDDRLVTAVTVLLADADGLPVAPPVSVAVNAAAREVDVDLPVLSERINSGPYVLTAIACDGTNEGRGFQAITVQAAPLRVRSMLLVPPVGSPPPITITRIDSAGAMSAFLSLPELGPAAIGLDHLFTTGAATQPLQRWRIPDGAAHVLMPNPGLWPAYFTGLSDDGAAGRLVAHGADGAVRVFQRDGAPAFAAQLPAGFVGLASVTVGGALACAARHPVTHQCALFRIGPSGEVLAQFDLPVEAVSLFAIDADRLLVFGNDAEGGIIREVSIGQGGGYTVRAFPGEPLRCVRSVNGALHLLGFAPGIRRFDWPAAAVTTLLPSIAPSGLAYDPVSGAVLAAEGSAVTAFNPLTGAVSGATVAPHPVGQVLLQLNR